jgi:hypothetical protein
MPLWRSVSTAFSFAARLVPLGERLVIVMRVIFLILVLLAARGMVAMRANNITMITSNHWMIVVPNNRRHKKVLGFTRTPELPRHASYPIAPSPT